MNLNRPVTSRFPLGRKRSPHSDGKRWRIVGLLSVLTAIPLMAGCAPGVAPPVASSPRASRPSATAEIAEQLRLLEQRYRARIGIAAFDTGSGRAVVYRADQRFAFASTNKTFIAATALHDQSIDLSSIIRYSKTDLLEYAPVTEKHLKTGMTIAALIDAALRFSDNTAANLLVKKLGGTIAVESFLRHLGDAATEVDRLEPDLNTAEPADSRDTTTPSAFAKDLRAVLLGSILPTSRRTILEDALKRNTTGGPYIRAGAPRGWTIADKTGAGSYGTRNDIAVLYPPQKAPIVLVIFTRRSTANAKSEDGLIASTTRVVIRQLVQ